MNICYNLLKRAFVALFVLSALLISANFRSVAQESCNSKAAAAAEEEEETGAHKITFSLGHAHVNKGIEDNESKWLVMGAWAFNYDYLFNSKWALGLHNDLIMEDFSVEDRKDGEEKTILERERPLATKLVGSFKPGKHLTMMMGAGDEIAKGNNYFLSTIGLDYGWHLPGGWELGAELSYDIKWHAYDTWILGAGISKIISKHHNKHRG